MAENKKKEANKLGILAWFLLGVFSMILGWTHFLTWVIGTYVYD